MINFAKYFHDFQSAINGTTVTSKPTETPVPLHFGLQALRDSIVQADAGGNKTILIGNGGSAAMASHIAIDLLKNGRCRAMAFNDPATLTCLANDYGYDQVFSKQVEMHADEGDVAILISSSGQSVNILKAADAARHANAEIFTFTGFREGNPLSRHGNLNFYVPSSTYGIVEHVHSLLLHSIIDGSGGLMGV